MKRVGPRSARRLLRSPAKALAYGIVAMLLVVAPVVETAVARNTAEALDTGWRGLYDILVLAPDGIADLQDAEGRQLLDPNFGAVSLPAIDNELVADITGMPGVEVAAPIGFVGRYGDQKVFPLLTVPMTLFEDDPDQTFRVRTRVIGDDGLGEKLLEEHYWTMRIDASDYTGVQNGGLVTAGIDIISARRAGGFVQDGYLATWLWQLPRASTTVVAVDPAAEAQLLGDEGRFLEPLLAFDEAVADLDAPLTVGDWDAKAPDALAPLMATEEAAPVRLGRFGETNPIVPFLRNEEAFPPTRLDVSITRVPPNTGVDMELAPEEMVELGTSSVDVDEARRPFEAGPIDVPWPGTEKALTAVGGDNGGPTNVGQLTLRPASGAPSERLGAFRVEPHGVRFAVNYATDAEPDGRRHGDERTYRPDARANTAPTPYLGGPQSRGAAPLEVGVYRPSDIDLGRDTTSYSPMGAYDPATATVIAPASPRAEAGAVLQPTSNGLGLVAPSPTAITTLRGAAEWGVEDPVTAIRVRVAGVDGWNQTSVARIEDVAARIEALGLQAYIVAGSSLQAVQVYVPDYVFGTMRADEWQTIADLGWVETNLTTIGVAAAASAATARTTALIGAIASGVAVLSLGVALAMQMGARRAGSRTLGSLAWSPREQFAWFAREDAWGVALVAAGAVAGALLAPLPGPALARGVVVLMAIAGAAAVSIGLVVRPLARRRMRPRPAARDGRSAMRERPVTRPWVATRLLWGDRWVVLLQAIGAAATVIGIATAAVLLIDAYRSLGTTRLGETVSAAVVGGQILLLAIGVAAGAAILIAGMRLGAVRDRYRRRVLDVAGWSPRSIARLAVPRVAIVMALTVVATAAAGGVVALRFAADASWVFVPVAAALTIALLVLHASRATR